MMKRIGWIVVLLLASTPVFAATKVTVAQLKEKLVALQQTSKEDQDVALALKQFDLTEQLTPAARAALDQFVMGTAASQQLDILEGRSAFLPPPTADLPATPAPDAAAQKAILAKAQDYASKTYTQTPHLFASKALSRYQDDAQNTSSSVGLTVNSPNLPAMFIDKRVDPIETEKGIEKPSPSKNKTKWGANGQISEGEPGPAVAATIQEATSGKIDWLRWETISGKLVAVFSFAVEKKKTHFDINYCCFPDTDIEAGIGTQAGQVQPVNGTVQAVTSWKIFKRVVGYHGQLFIDPDTGAVVRLITFADMKPTDFIHQEWMRIDYGAAVVDGKQYLLPEDSYTLTEVVPNGDSPAVAYSVLHILFAARYTGYVSHR